MSSPLSRFFAGLGGRRGIIESVVPRRTFADVVLPPATRRALDEALTQVRARELIFERWGLGERHPTGTALAFNFAGPSGTGKTICAEAIANELGKRLLLVRYAEMESMWFGETPKNVAAVFRLALEEDAVLFFDEADAIASRRSTEVSLGSQREANTVVNVLLQELERFDGVVIFATNLAANFDPAFERRIRSHVLFERPGVAERERIWPVQVHPTKTPLADDVDFRSLAEQFDATGGEIRNAVLKAALAAASGDVPDEDRAIHQHHFAGAMEDVLAGSRVMRQSIMAADDGASDAARAPQALDDRLADTLAAAGQVRSLALVGAGLAGTALLTALAALLVALLR
ncbi:MAG TPA: ATP-binding protein [Longimicrobiales bacterium]|nr:ATP-binding protein [Longimicrobiales bacterium]